MTSDKILKSKIKRLSPSAALKAIDALRPVSFDHERREGRQFGLVAQEVAVVIPEAVMDLPDAHPDHIDSGRTLKSIDIFHLLAHAVGAIQELSARIAALEAPAAAR